MLFLDHLADFLRSRGRIRRGDRVLVAFSGGPDSTALLWGLRQVAPGLGIGVSAAHLDHGLDRGSSSRARQARELARGIGVHCHCGKLATDASKGGEAAAREARYAFLERQRRRLGARFVATGHHRDDQAETVLLRLLYGSGIDGLAAIPPLRGTLLRPLLGLDRLALDGALRQARLEGREDPTNRDLSIVRNRVRHLLLPGLERKYPTLRARLSTLAEKSLAARERIDARLEELLQPVPGERGLKVRRVALEALPPPLLGAALRFLGRRAGLVYPPSRRAREELRRQLGRQRRIGCDCGRGWAIRSRGAWLELARGRPKAPGFTYTLEVPGSIELAELGLRFHVTPSRVSPWMFRSFPQRAALALPLRPGERVTIRNRRPGDRIQPFGWERHCRVKELLINRNVPRDDRWSLPFLCSAGEIAWIPGVTISEHTRISSERSVWVAEIERA